MPEERLLRIGPGAGGGLEEFHQRTDQVEDQDDESLAPRLQLQNQKQALQEKGGQKEDVVATERRVPGQRSLVRIMSATMAPPKRQAHPSFNANMISSRSAGGSGRVTRSKKRRPSASSRRRRKPPGAIPSGTCWPDAKRHTRMGIST